MDRGESTNTIIMWKRYISRDKNKSLGSVRYHMYYFVIFLRRGLFSILF